MYFQTVGTTLLAGRDFDEHDTEKSLSVAIVSEGFAKRFWSARDALGRRFREVGSKKWITVVGVVGDARYEKLKDAPQLTAYLPIAQQPMPGWTQHLEIWTSINPAEVIPSIRALFRRTAPHLLLEPELFSDYLDRQLVYERLVTVLAACFGSIGLIVSGIGVYGTTAYSVARRTREVGIRISVGATPSEIFRMIFKEQFILLCAGVVFGAIGMFAIKKIVRAWLFGINASDPTSFVGAIILLSAVTAVASFMPARRASKMDPMQSLRFQ